MYQRYLADPGSVDPAWHEFFADYPRQAGRPAHRRPRTGCRRRRRHAAAPAPAAAASERHRRSPSQPPRPTARPRSDRHRRAPGSGQAARARRPPARPTAAEPRPDRSRAPRRRTAEPATASPRRATGGKPAAAAPKPAGRRQAGRGEAGGQAAADGRSRSRCAASPPGSSQNMETSRCTVPTATSVRAVPAKLLVDNRIVINNHLAPGPRRQGQLHPPDRLRDGPGAAPTHPEMNNSFAEVDGKPALVTPGARQPGHRDRPARPRTAPARWSWPAIKARRARWTSASSGGVRGHRPAGPAAAS